MRKKSGQRSFRGFSKQPQTIQQPTCSDLDLTSCQHESPSNVNRFQLSNNCQWIWSFSRTSENSRNYENKNGFLISATKERVPIKQRLDCKTKGLLYVVVCSKCPDRLQYIGKKKRTLMERGREHLQNIGKLKEGTYSKPVSKLYNHFIKNGHTTQDFVIFGIEEIFGDELTAILLSYCCYLIV